MSNLWKEHGCSKTPKAHLLFDHAADEQERWGGLGDKLEDPLEKRHQYQMSLVSVLKRIPDETKRMQAQNKREWMLSNPLSLKILDNIYTKGNKAAGTRLRKGLQEIKNLAQEIRVDVSEKKKAEAVA